MAQPDQTSQLILYCHPGSPYVRPILSLLYEADVPFIDQFVDLLKGEQSSEQYKAINPLGTVPCIKDGAFVLAESTAILRYVCRSRGLTKYYPENDFIKVALIDRLFGLCPSFFEQTIGKAVSLKLSVARYGKALNEEEFQKLLQEGASNIQKFEALLTNSFIAGDEISIADMYLFSIISHAVFFISFDLAPFQKFNAWYERVAACKGPTRTIQRFKEAMAIIQAAQESKQAKQQAQ